MKLSVIALDYDGTIARQDVLDVSVRPAIVAARKRGIAVLLVTGRILDELRRVMGELHLVDGVVAENGASVYFPDSGHTSILASPIPPAFVAELRRRDIPFALGRCLVDANATEAPRLLEVIRSLELPLALAFNGGRVMVLPQGVSKATGLHAALETLRLSARNTLAIGDAENDHELLRLAEVGVAVEWGSQALRGAADIELHGAGPADVATYVRMLAESGRLPVPDRARRRLVLGRTDDGREFSLAVRGRIVLVAGDAKSGKSWVAGLLCEQLILHGYSVCVIDPEGDYRSLEALPGVSVLGGEDPPPTPRELLRALRYPDRSLVIDLSRRRHEEKLEYLRTVLPALNAIRRRTGLPHRIVLDEAHYFLQDEDARQLLAGDSQGYTVVTYSASRLPRALLAATEVMIVTRESDPREIEALRQWCTTCGPTAPARWALLAQLPIGHAMALPVTTEAGGDLRRFRIAPRLTPHVRHREKYVDVPVASPRAFHFTAGSAAVVPHAHTLRQFVAIVEESPVAGLDGYLRRRDFSRWIADVFGDYPLATTLRGIEAQYIAGNAPAAAAVTGVVAAIRERYDLLSDSQR